MTFWTEDELSRAQQMRREGHGHHEIAAALGRPYSSVKSRLNQSYGLRKPKPTRETSMAPTSEDWAIQREQLDAGSAQMFAAMIDAGIRYEDDPRAVKSEGLARIRRPVRIDQSFVGNAAARCCER